MTRDLVACGGNHIRDPGVAKIETRWGRIKRNFCMNDDDREDLYEMIDNIGAAMLVIEARTDWRSHSPKS